MEVTFFELGKDITGRNMTFQNAKGNADHLHAVG